MVDNKAIPELPENFVPGEKGGWVTRPYYERGRAAGGAKLLTRLLEKRFGTLPTALHQRIFEADAAAIEAWYELALDDGHDLQSIFVPILSNRASETQ